MIAESAIIYPDVHIGDGAVIEDYCIIGCPGSRGSSLTTTIGKNAHIRSHTVIYAGNRIGENFITGNKVNVRENNSIGNNVSIGTLTVIEHSTLIGNEVRIHSQAFIPEFTEIRDNGWIGPNVVMTNSKYPNTRDSKRTLRGPVVSEGARIGANATLLPGVTIGKLAIVGAGSVVTRDVDDFAIVAGNPAKFVRRIDSEGG